MQKARKWFLNIKNVLSQSERKLLYYQCNILRSDDINAKTRSFFFERKESNS